MDWIMFHQNSLAKTLTPTVTVFRDRAFKEIIKIKWAYRMEP